jgi:hypothetical protein
MARLQINMRMTEAEQALLARRAKAEGISEADYLRVCMVMDSVIAGDMGAVKILADHLRSKLAEKFRPKIDTGNKLMDAILAPGRR